MRTHIGFYSPLNLQSVATVQGHENHRQARFHFVLIEMSTPYSLGNAAVAVRTAMTLYPPPSMCPTSRAVRPLEVVMPIESRPNGFFGDHVVDLESTNPEKHEKYFKQYFKHFFIK